MRTEPITMRGLIEEIEFQVTRRRVRRVDDAIVVGIAGAPGAGKSTTSEILMRKLEAKGIITSFIPMDSYHYSTEVLNARGLADQKGTIETFNVEDFVRNLQRAYVGLEDFWVPRYSRELEEPIASSLQVTADSDVVITEGNYLLMKERHGWAAIHKILDIAVYLQTPEDVRRERLFQRHVGSKGEEGALAWIENVDMPNASRVEASIKFANFIMKNDEGENAALGQPEDDIDTKPFPVPTESV